MSARVQALPALSFCSSLQHALSRKTQPQSFCSSLQHALSRKTQPQNPSICRLFSMQSLSRRRTSLAASVQARRGFSYQEEDFASPSDLFIEGPLKIVEYPDPRLRARNKRINIFDENLKKLANKMFDVMYTTDGIGLSAPQVGLNIQLIVFNPVGECGQGEEIVLVNPVVYKASKKTLLYNEGCLSFPGIYADVERPASVKIDARDITGARFRVNLSSLPARIFQHEFDHLQGTLFFDRMTEEVLDSIRSELLALEKKYEDLTGQSSPEKIDNYKPRKQFAGFART